MAVTEVYVDPAIAANSGSGTIGDPYGDLQYALDTKTRNTTNGDRFNIKAGTDETFSAEISLATYGTPTFTAPLVFQGYTSAAGDGGKFGLSGGGGTFNLWNKTTAEGVYFVDGRIHNFGSVTGSVFNCDRFCGFHRMEFENITVSTAVITCDDSSRSNVSETHFHDIAGICVGNNMDCHGCYFKNDGAKTITSCVSFTTSGTCWFCIASLSGASNFCASTMVGVVCHNSVLSSSGTGVGVRLNRSLWGPSYGNIVEGFSGSGGIGFKIETSTSDEGVMLGYNAAYNNSTNYSSWPTSDYDMLGGNETLSGTAFAKSGSDTFANRFTYFAPVDTGSVYGSVLGNRDKGAVRRVASGSGGLVRGGSLTGGLQ